MSIKKILAFVLLLLLAYAGVYMAIYSAERYMLYSGTERNFEMMSGSELQPNLNVKGSIETVTHLLYTETVSSNILGIPIGSTKRYYYVLPVGYQADYNKQQYCVFAVSGSDNAAAVEELMKSRPVPPDSAAPRFEFQGISMDMSDEVYQQFKAYLQDEYHDESIHDFLLGANVDHNLVPYIIYVKGKNDNNLLTPIIVGGVCAVLGIGLFILLAIRTYRKAHMYD